MYTWCERLLNQWYCRRLGKQLRSDDFGVYRVVQIASGRWDVEKRSKCSDNFCGAIRVWYKWDSIITCYSIAGAQRQINLYKADAAFDYFKQQRRLNNAIKRSNA